MDNNMPLTYHNTMDQPHNSTPQEEIHAHYN